MRLVRLLLAIAAAVAGHAGPARAGDRGAAALVLAYPEQIEKLDGQSLVFKDGTRIAISGGAPPRTLEQQLANGDITDMFAMRYPLGKAGVPPPEGFDPGRIRPQALFDKLYGNCLKEGMSGRLATVVWLPRKVGAKLRFAAANGAAKRLQEVSDELDRLPDRFLTYLNPPAGTFNCRRIAGTERPSPHGYGIAIDLATAHAHYWLWTKADANGVRAYRNEIPWEIVHIFERHGFVWGGKWHHFDTMHFEYRPELLIDAED